MACKSVYCCGSNHLLSQPKVGAFIDNAGLDWFSRFGRHHARTWFGFQFYQPDCNPYDCRNRYRRWSPLHQHILRIRSSQAFRRNVENRQSRYFNLSDNPRRFWLHCLIPLSRFAKHGICCRHRYRRLYVCFNYHTSCYFFNDER